MPAGPNRSQLHPWSVASLQLHNLPGFGLPEKTWNKHWDRLQCDRKLICNRQLRKSKAGPQSLCLTISYIGAELPAASVIHFLGRSFHVSSSGEDLEVFFVARHQGLFPLVFSVQDPQLVFTFLSWDSSHWSFLHSLCQASRRHCPSRAGSWHQRGDFQTPWNVLLAAQNSLGSLGQDLKLRHLLNSLECLSTVEISLAGDEIICIFIQALAIVCPYSWASQVGIFAAPVFSYLCSMK